MATSLLLGSLLKTELLIHDTFEIDLLFQLGLIKLDSMTNKVRKGPMNLVYQIESMVKLAAHLALQWHLIFI